MRRSTILGFAVLAAGCAADVPGRPAAEATDSAGVPVIVNPEPRPASDPSWIVAGTPAVEIGVLDGPPEYQLFQITGGVLLSDGTIVVSNRGSHELRWYDVNGEHLRSVGGEGDGPGEFRSVSLVGVFEGDSLLTFDWQQRRTSVFDREGTFVRSSAPGEGAGLRFPFVGGVLSGGRTVIQQGAVYMAGEATTGVDRGSTVVYVAQPDGTVTDSIGEFPASEAYVLAEDNRLSVRSLAFGRGLSIAASGDRIAIGNNDAFSVGLYDGSGTLLHVVRQVREPAPVTTEFETYMQEQLETIDDENWLRTSRRIFEQMPRHQTFPAYGATRLDRVGYLWVEEYPRPGDYQAAWQVFNPEGRLVARVEPPPGLRILDIGSDHLLGVVQDEFEVERLRIYRLERDTDSPDG